MKKVFAILLTVGFLAGMSACGGSAPAPVAEPEAPQVEETIPPCDEQVDGEEAVEEAPTEEQVQE
jgi:hypothetical protein